MATEQTKRQVEALVRALKAQRHQVQVITCRHDLVEEARAWYRATVPEHKQADLLVVTKRFTDEPAPRAELAPGVIVYPPGVSG